MVDGLVCIVLMVAKSIQFVCFIESFTYTLASWSGGLRRKQIPPTGDTGFFGVLPGFGEVMLARCGATLGEGGLGVIFGLVSFGAFLTGFLEGSWASLS